MNTQLTKGCRLDDLTDSGCLWPVVVRSGPLGEMATMRRKLSVLSGAACVAITIFADHYAAAQGNYRYPTPPPQNQAYEPPPAEPEPIKKVSAHRGFQGGFNIGVPIWLDVDTKVVRPGADLHFFGGYDMGYVMFGVNLGAMWTPIDGNQIPGLSASDNPGRYPVTRLYVAPEVRAQVPNKSPILPYVAMTFDINWWHFRQTGIVCNFWYCAQVNVFNFTPGFTAKAGIAFRIKQGAHIDLGVKYSLSGPGDFFLRREQWVTPYLGFFFR